MPLLTDTDAAGSAGGFDDLELVAIVAALIFECYIPTCRLTTDLNVFTTIVFRDLGDFGEY